MTIEQEKLRQSIDQAVDFLKSQQQSDGSFSSLSSSSLCNFEAATTYQTNFVPALILSSLAAIDTPTSLDVRCKLAKFLISERSDHWSYNYWSSAAPERKDKPYPDDLDDTFCALSSLVLHDARLVDEAALAQIVKLLIVNETQPGGPYRTWLVDKNQDAIWRDVDIAVNSNIAYFLSLIGLLLPSLTEHLRIALHKKRLYSVYYPTAYPIAYYMSRALRTQQVPELQSTLRELLRTSSSILERALCVSGLLNNGSGKSLQRVIAGLLSAQADDGSWEAAAFCIDPSRSGKKMYNGCRALTTAFVAEALQLFLQAQTPAPKTVTKKLVKGSALSQQVRTTALRWAGTLPDQLTRDMAKELTQTSGGRSGAEIVMLGARFNDSLRRPLRKTAPDFFVTLGVANLSGWLAYTIYDDFLDDAGQPRLLSVANVAHRESLFAFVNALPKCQDFQKLVRQTFDAIDNANAWEIAHCRFHINDGIIHVGTLPNYGRLDKLAERSLGHVLTPLAVLRAKGVHVATPAFRAIQRAFKHYLIARQLNDDLHDWQEDLSRGHISYVVCKILQNVGLDKPTYKLAKLMPELQRQFWYETLQDVCQTMHHHIALSRRAIGQAAMLETNDIISDLLNKLELSLTKTLHQQHSAQRFLQSYQAKTT